MLGGLIVVGTHLVPSGDWDSNTANALFQFADVYGLAPRSCVDYVYLEPTGEFLASMLADWQAATRL